MFTTVPAPPSLGEKSKMIGPVLPKKFEVLVPVPDVLFTTMGPFVVLALVMVTCKCVAEIALIDVVLPPIVTFVVVERLKPSIETAVFTLPNAGEKFVMIGWLPVWKMLVVVKEFPLTVTLIGPLVAPEGTVA